MMTPKEANLELLASYPPLAFLYDAESKQFTVGTEQVPLGDFDEYGRRIPSATPTTPEQAQLLIDESSLLLNIFGTHFQTPRMYRWLTSLDAGTWKKTSDAVVDVMIDVFAEVGDMPRKELLKGTHWGFGAGLYRPGHPSFTVLGDCACYGVSPQGHVFEEHDWKDGFAEYALHNIDFPAQRIALYAGAGALAAMVKD
jgi:hypothetical protein